MNIKNLKYIALSLLFSLFACSNQINENDNDDNNEQLPPINIPKGDVTVAAYYFPNWGPVAIF